jgi:hypothetical protein
VTQEEAIALIRELLLAESEAELQKLIAAHLPEMDSTFFAVLVEAAESETTRNPALRAQLTSLAQALLPLRTLI